ncbi:MAG: dihydrodipicolinate synthase family protein [Paracoccaceae bacterium]
MSFFGGVNCAAATPVQPDGAPDLRLFAAHCRALLDEGAHGLAILGTTGEANSFAAADRMALVEAALAAGVRGDQLLPGTSACNVAETVTMTRHAVQSGARGCVLLPPFYYKGASDEGLFRFYAQVIEGVADSRLRVILYHIPQVTQVPISHDLIDRLLREFPGVVVGIKDSSGDFDNMKGMLSRFAGFTVLAGADPVLLPLLQMGGGGCITATSNLRSADLRIIFDAWQDPGRAAEVAAAQERINAWRGLTNAYVQLPTVKTMLARSRGDLGWLNLRPPLVPLSAAECQSVWDRMAALGG